MSERAVIVNKEDLSGEMIHYSGLYDLSKNSVKGSNQNSDGSKHVFFYVGDKPECFEGMDDYSTEEMRTEVQKDNWR